MLIRKIVLQPINLANAPKRSTDKIALPLEKSNRELKTQNSKLGTSFEFRVTVRVRARVRVRLRVRAKIGGFG